MNDIDTLIENLTTNLDIIINNTTLYQSFTDSYIPDTIKMSDDVEFVEMLCNRIESWFTKVSNKTPSDIESLINFLEINQESLIVFSYFKSINSFIKKFKVDYRSIEIDLDNLGFEIDGKNFISDIIISDIIDYYIKVIKDNDFNNIKLQDLKYSGKYHIIKRLLLLTSSNLKELSNNLDKSLVYMYLSKQPIEDITYKLINNNHIEIYDNLVYLYHNKKFPDHVALTLI